jgi:hypothetical protein
LGQTSVSSQFWTRRKLQLKDAIAKLKSAMIPDLDA